MKKEELFQLLGKVNEEKIFLADNSKPSNNFITQKHAYSHSLENLSWEKHNNLLHSFKKTTSRTSKKKERQPSWLRWCTLAVCICISIGFSTYFYQLKNTGGSGFGENSGFFENNFLGDKDVSILKPHREDFTPVIENTILAQFDEHTEVLKSYVLLTNTWFLSDKVTDFSQVVTTDCFYVVSGGKEGTESISPISLDLTTPCEDSKPPWNALK